MIDRVDTIASAQAALSLQQYRTVIVDRMLPDGEGLELAREIRQLKTPPPILVLTALNGVAERVEGLDAGADDYLEKPFDMNELAARLRALSRRGTHLEEEVLMAGRLTFRSETRTVSTSEGTVKLSLKETLLLEQLMRRFGVTVLRERLEQAVYGLDETPTSNALEAHISRLRKKLGAADTDVELHTMRGIGYLLKRSDP